MRKTFLLVFLLTMGLIVAYQGMSSAGVEDVAEDPHALEQAINNAHEEGPLNKDDPEGYLGIPGAPQINLVLAFFWACIVGWIFSTVGAFGGIAAGIGHISIYGLGAYADKFEGKSAALNTATTNTIRVANQFPVGFSALISSINYWKMGRLVVPVGITLALGSILGSYLVPALTAGRVEFSDYIAFFGVFVLILGCWVLYQTTSRGQRSKQKANEAAKRYQEAMKQKRGGVEVDTSEMGVRMTSFFLKKIGFTFYGQAYWCTGP